MTDYYYFKHTDEIVRVKPISSHRTEIDFMPLDCRDLSKVSEWNAKSKMPSDFKYEWDYQILIHKEGFAIKGNTDSTCTYDLIPIERELVERLLLFRSEYLADTYELNEVVKKNMEKYNKRIKELFVAYYVIEQ
ncbi:hypothetical protein FACS189472_06000 [Alphaproteobacteria bacterium]|nr:hypothetical protein FACS189472_06000 [Alphaproteobacteria bacterium]